VIANRQPGFVCEEASNGDDRQRRALSEGPARAAARSRRHIHDAPSEMTKEKTLLMHEVFAL
jgi:hypothetical protein